MSIEYATIEQASRAALIDAYNCGEQRRECGGIIYRRTSDGKYWYTVPVTQDKPFNVTIEALYYQPPPGATLVADYHNHICSKHNKEFAQFFSVGDVLSNSVFHTIGYMLDGCTGLIHRFDPAQDDRDDEEVKLTSGRVFYLTIGHVSGWIDIFL